MSLSLTFDRAISDGVRGRWTTAIITGIVLHGHALFACECAEGTQREALRYAAVVFRGTVTNIEHLNPIVPREGRPADAVKLVPIPRNIDDHTLVTFRVRQGWKGRITPTIRVFAVARPSMCDGYRFQIKSEYVVYASKNLNPDWDELQPFKDGGVIFDVAECPLRVRTDVLSEVRRLGRAQTEYPESKR